MIGSQSWIKRNRGVLGVMATIVISSLGYGADLVDKFLAIPDYHSTEGEVVYTDNNTDVPANMNFRLTWHNGDFIKEILTVGKGEQGTNVYNVIDATGQFQGTNWTYRGGALTITKELSDNSLLIKSHLGGLSPAENMLVTLLGRGFRPDELQGAKKTGESSFTAKYDGKVPVACFINETNGLFTLNFARESSNGRLDYERKFTLIPFGKDAYVPGILKCFLTRVSGENIDKDIIISSLTNSVDADNLSPWKRYKIEELRLREKDRLVEIGPKGKRTPILKHSELEEAKGGGKGRLALVVGFVTVVFLIWAFYRSFNKKTQ